MLACYTCGITPVIVLVCPLTLAPLNKVIHYALSLLLFNYLFDLTVYWYASWVFGFRCRSLHHHILSGKHAVNINDWTIVKSTDFFKLKYNFIFRSFLFILHYWFFYHAFFLLFGRLHCKRKFFTGILIFICSYERFEVLAVFASTMLAQLGALFIIKERYIYWSFITHINTCVYLCSDFWRNRKQGKFQNLFYVHPWCRKDGVSFLSVMLCM